MQNLIRILLLICSLWPFTTSSQPILQIKAGVNRSSMDWDFKDYRWGLHAGSAARFDLSQGFYLQPEILFSIKGSKVQEDIFVIPGYEIEYIFEYLGISVDIDPCFPLQIDPPTEPLFFMPVRCLI